MGKREARLLAKDLSPDAGENGKALIGFTGAKSRPSRLLLESERVGSLQAVALPGHTPGHMAYLDLRDNTRVHDANRCCGRGRLQGIVSLPCSFFLERGARREERRKTAWLKSGTSCRGAWPVDFIPCAANGCGPGRGVSPASGSKIEMQIEEVARGLNHRID